MQEMALYDEVKENLTASSKQHEPIAAFLESAATIFVMVRKSLRRIRAITGKRQ